MPGGRCARSLVCNRVESAQSIQVTPESPGIPRAMVLTAYIVLSPVTGLFCHRRRRSFADLTPASGCQDHTTLPSASSAVRQAHPASTASRPAFVTIARRPSIGAGWLRV